MTLDSDGLDEWVVEVFDCQKPDGTPALERFQANSITEAAVWQVGCAARAEYANVQLRFETFRIM